MKLLLVFTLVFGFCLFGSTVGLQCYQCKDISLNTKCEEIIIQTCGPEVGYCGTLSLVEKSGESIVQKGCIPKSQDVLCKIGETVEVDPDPKGRKGSLLCCEGNLCNSSNKLYNGNILFIAIVLGCIYSVAGWMFN